MINHILNHADLKKLEKHLCEDLARFLKFNSCAIYFPTEPVEEGILLAQEKRLIFPLFWRDEKLGAVTLGGVRAKEGRRLIPWLSGIASLSLEAGVAKLALGRDAATGLATEEAFFSQFRDLTQAAALPASSGLHKLCMGLISFVWNDADSIIKTFGHDSGQGAWLKAGAALRKLLPEDAIAAERGKYAAKREYALLLPAAAHAACQRLAKMILEKLGALAFKDRITGRLFHLELLAGYALYPNDLKGEESRLPATIQAMLLLDRARHASRYAASKNSVQSFGGILRESGQILGVLPGGKLRLNIGKKVNALPGQRFDVHSTEGAFKGVIAIIETHEEDSLAEALFFANPVDIFLPGDNLRQSGNNKGQDNEIVTNWLRREEFFLEFAAKGREPFCLGISRFSFNDKNSPENIEDISANIPDTISDESLIDNFFEEISGLTDVPQLRGKYGPDGLIFYHPGIKYESVRPFYEKLAEIGARYGITLASGIFSWPFLDYGKNESEASALKALEYAMLLPEPGIGALDSVALNISGDKLYSLGDIFGAVKEYERALMADKNNAMARNSLGVALGTLGKTDEALRFFQEALSASNDKGLQSRICYNIGAIYQKKGEMEEAGQYFQRCLDLDSSHAWARLRLGMTRESEGNFEQAAKLYAQAALDGEDAPEIVSVANRRLALLEEKLNHQQEAREILHETLLFNPTDAAAIQALAKLYLVEDPGMAEMLARKAVKISGDASAWDLLIKALEAGGKTNDAEIARKTRNGTL